MYLQPKSLTKSPVLAWRSASIQPLLEFLLYFAATAAVHGSDLVFRSSSVEVVVSGTLKSHSFTITVAPLTTATQILRDVAN